MTSTARPPDAVRILTPSGMLGAGFPPETADRGLELGADVIAIDGGSTDSGPHYLGSGTVDVDDPSSMFRLVMDDRSRA